MIVDAHLHLWKKIEGRVAGSTPVVSLGRGMIRVGDDPMLGMPPVHLDGSAPAEWVLAEFDAAGVDAGVVVQEYLDGPQNEYLLEVAARWPDRFFVHALPDFFQPDRVAAEAMELFDRGFRGLKVCGGHLAGQVTLDDPRFEPIWERMAAEGLVLAADLAAGAEQVGMMETILARHPGLRVAIGHLGMVTRGDWLSQVRLCGHEHVYVETGGVLWLFRGEGYPFRGAVEAIRRAKQEVGTEKLMWGSDWPRTMVDFTYRQSIDFLRTEETGLSEADTALLLGGNAARLYNLAEPTAARRPAARITEG